MNPSETRLAQNKLCTPVDAKCFNPTMNVHLLQLKNPTQTEETNFSILINVLD